MNQTTNEIERPAKLLGRTARVLTVVLVVSLLALWGVYRASQQVPDFYAQALVATPEQQETAGYQLEQEVLDLHNDLQELQTWEAFFSEEEVNGWLAADLSRKFPNFLPPEIQDPRVDLEKGQLTLACRYHGGGLSTVVHLTVLASMADEPNTLALRLHKARAGMLPLPMKSFLEHISTAAEQLSLPLRWTQVAGDPVALLTLPSEFKSFENRKVEFTVVDILEGKIRIGGHARDDGEAPES